MSKKRRGEYTPTAGMDPEKIHWALARINTENGGRGATAEAVAQRSRVSLAKVRHELRVWGPHGNNGAVVDSRNVGGEARFLHTHRYVPRPDVEARLRHLAMAR